jgi:transposase
MQTRREKLGYEMTLLPPLEQLVPEDHPLRGLDRVLDLGFVHEAVRDRYCQDNGRPSVDPEVVIRLFLLQAVEGIPHVRELMRDVQVNLAYRWFIGYRMDEALPDHSTLSKALDRIGESLFDELFVRSVAQCRESGLIEGRVLHLDATTIRADLDARRVGEPDSPDPDARFGKFPGKHTAPGYKQQTVVDGSSRVVLAVAVTSADRPEGQSAVAAVDQAMARLETVPEAVCADAAYASGANRAALEKRDVRLVSPPPKPRTYTGDDYFTTEDFTYDAARDEFTCPAGATLRFVGLVKDRPGKRRYQGQRSICRACALRAQCTRARKRQLKVGVDHAALVRLREDSHTVSFQQLYRTRFPTIEGVFAEAKQWHGLRRAWRRGLSNMRVQCWLVAAVLNFKRLAAVSTPIAVVISATDVIWQALRTTIRSVWGTTRVVLCQGQTKTNGIQIAA